MRSLLLSILIAGQAAFPCAVIATPTTPTSRGPEASAAQGAKSISQYEGRKRERRKGREETRQQTQPDMAGKQEQKAVRNDAAPN
ncbi:MULTISPECIES: hypothetical protein [Cupriavidus]|uniref:hypothetical protein n=1 Tax=Cupriavidus sp. DF5525 TaxID=3160989 RepID=UPI0032DF7F58